MRAGVFEAASASAPGALHKSRYTKLRLVKALRAIRGCQIGSASASADLCMIPACSTWSPLVNLDLAEAEGVFNHRPAALEAAILESLQGGGQRLLPLDLLREDDGVFDSGTGARPEVRRRRINGVADQNDAPLRPRPRHQHPFERTVHDVPM